MPTDLPPLRLHDTRLRGVEGFVAGRTVRLYVCGITPYDASHLGHAFTYSAFDVLVRALELRGHRVRHCRNVTDVDDDIVRAARERGVEVADLAARETATFRTQMGALGLRAPDVEPTVSGTVEAIVAAVRALVQRGHAYVVGDGRVYFDVATADGPAFGALEDLSDDQRLARFAEGGGDPDAPGKRQPLDLLLWQPPGYPSGATDSPVREPTWDSDWGPGRPGWHIECSVMAMEELGPTIDVHGGGRDLTFPHHEAEILQSESLTGQRPFARSWLHTGMVGLEGEKMAKSAGNLVVVPDLLAEHAAGAVRRELLDHHYRDDWSFEADRLAKSAEAYERWRAAAAEEGRDGRLEAEFHAAIADDLDTPTAVELLDEAAARGAGTTLVTLAATLGIEL